MSRRRAKPLPTSANRNATMTGSPTSPKEADDEERSKPDQLDRREDETAAAVECTTTTKAAAPCRGKDVRNLKCLQVAASTRLRERNAKKEETDNEAEEPGLVAESDVNLSDSKIEDEPLDSRVEKSENGTGAQVENAHATAATPTDSYSWLHASPFPAALALPTPLPIVASSLMPNNLAREEIVSHHTPTASAATAPSTSSAGLLPPGQAAATPPGAGLVPHGHAFASGWGGLMPGEPHHGPHQPYGWMAGLPYHTSPGASIFHSLFPCYSIDMTHINEGDEEEAEIHDGGDNDDDDDEDDDDDDDDTEDVESTGTDAKHSTSNAVGAHLSSIFTPIVPQGAVLLSSPDGTPVALLESHSTNVSDLFRTGAIQVKSMGSGKGSAKVTAVLHGEKPTNLTPTPARKYLRWTEQEDDTLREAVKEQQDAPPINWKRISRKYFNGLRSSLQCKNRWKKCLQPGLRRDPWSKEEDKIVIDCMEKGMKWSEISKQLTGRIPEQIRDHWINQLDPTLKKGPWTEEEIEILFRSQAEIGNKWSEIAKKLPGRSENAVKNRWHNAKVAQRRKLKKLAKEAEVADRLKAARDHDDFVSHELLVRARQAARESQKRKSSADSEETGSKQKKVRSA